MVITVTCPSCSSAFPVDPAKIPEGGVNARCSSCGDIFRIEKPAPPMTPATLEAPAPPAAAPAPPAPPAAPPAPPEPEPVAEAPAPPPVPDLPDPIPVAPDPAPSAPTPTADPFSEAAPFEGGGATPAATPVQGFTFGKRDPTDKAKRLARVLVSDMIMYNAERHQAALAEGTLAEDFEEEIQKSWKEYVEQVGDELANGAGRGFWTEALNDILAKGEQVF